MPAVLCMNPVASAIMVPHPPIIIPNVGLGEEQKISDITAAYQKAAKELIDSKPETVIIISPHAPSYYDYMQISSSPVLSGSLAQFRDPYDDFEIHSDLELISEIEKQAAKEGLPAGTLGVQDGSLDHGTMVPLYFLQGLPEDTKFVRMSIGGPDHISHYRLGMALAKAAEKLGRKIAIVASGDLSHCQKEGTNYGYKACGPAYDAKIMDIMGNADFMALVEMPEKLEDDAMSCGHKSFCIMAGALDGLKPETETLAHSAEFGVGYGVVGYQNMKEDDSRSLLEQLEREKKEANQKRIAKEDPYVALARAALNAYLGKPDTEQEADKAQEEIEDFLEKPEIRKEEALFDTRAGAFVSLHKNGQLRGCIGTTAPTRDNLALEIMNNAMSAALNDPRFPAVQPDELEDLEINVDVLHQPEPISSPDQLNVKKFGVIVSKGSRRGLLLPDLEGVDTVEQQIAIARQKGGIRADEPVSLERFEVVRHK